MFILPFWLNILVVDEPFLKIYAGYHFDVMVFYYFNIIECIQTYFHFAYYGVFMDFKILKGRVGKNADF